MDAGLKAVVIDECHYLKNSKAYWTKDVQHLCEGVDHIICLSGTPILSRPIELYNAVQLIDPSVFPSYMDFIMNYCGATHNGFGWDLSGATNTEELHDKLTSTIMLRRLKRDMLKDLPEKTRTVIPLEISNRSEYRQVSRDFLGWLESKDPKKMESASRAEAIVKINYLKRLTAEGKMKQAMEWLRNFIDQDEKVVVFCVHKAVVKMLKDRFKGVSVVITGETPLKDRQTAVDQFQTNPSIRMLIGNIKAAGVGITLTAASNVCFVELGWTPALHDQAEDRVHRIGQKADSVNAWYLLAEDTVEMDIAEVLDEKRRVLTSILDGGAVEESSMLTALINRIRDGA